MQSSQVIEHINAFDVDGLRRDLGEAPVAEGEDLQAIIENTVDWINHIRNDLISVVGEVGEGDDIAMTLAVNYVEYKSRWIAFNTKMNYMMFKGNTASTSEQCRAAAVSAFLGHIEPLLNEGDIERISEFLAQPLSNAA